MSKDRYSAMTKQIPDRGETRKENASHWRQNGKLTRLCFVNDGGVRKKGGNLIAISGRPSERAEGGLTPLKEQKKVGNLFVTFTDPSINLAQNLALLARVSNAISSSTPDGRLQTCSRGEKLDEANGQRNALEGGRRGQASQP